MRLDRLNVWEALAVVQLDPAEITDHVVRGPSATDEETHRAEDSVAVVWTRRRARTADMPSARLKLAGDGGG